MASPQDPKPKRNLKQKPVSTAPAAEVDAGIKLHSTGIDKRYEIRDEIARGGMGAILRVVDYDIRRHIAMKVLLNQKVSGGFQRFIEEAQVTGQLEHPNIVPVHELGVDSSNRPYFTMKLVRGRSLKELVDSMLKRRSKRGQTELVQLLGIFVNVCHAMAFAHARGVVHRDLKPANIMVGDFGEVLVMDWGLAKVGAARGKGKESVRTRGTAPARREGQSSSQGLEISPDRVTSHRHESNELLTMQGKAFGTPMYMAPEQAKGQNDLIDERTDIYALGAILYNLLTLQSPIKGREVKDILKKAAAGKIIPPEKRAPGRAIPPELSAIAMKAMQRKKRARYPSVTALREDIELFLAGRAVSAKADAPWETVIKLVKRNKAASAVGGLAAALLFFAVGIGYHENSKQRQRAENALVDAEKERDRAQQALDQFQTEQARRLAEQKKAAPAYLERAEKALQDRDFKTALADVTVALGNDPDLADAHLLKAQLLIHTRNVNGARKHLQAYQKQVPDDEDVETLLELCDLARRKGYDTAKPRFAQVFYKQGMYALTDAAALQNDKTFGLYRKQVAQALPGHERALRTLKGGGLILGLAKKKVSGLSGLQGIPLVHLDLRSTRVRDLSPLRGMPLQVLILEGTPVESLDALSGLPLEQLVLNKTSITNLTPLRGMPLKKLTLYETRVSELRPLSGLPLEYLDARQTRVRDLSPLAGLPLSTLLLGRCKDVVELAPLKGMKLVRLSVGFTGVRSLSPLRGMPLKNLDVCRCPVQSFEEIRGMKLVSLHVGSTKFSDTGLLKGMPLTHLNIGNCPVKDVAPLKQLPLEELTFSPGRVTSGMAALEQHKTLQVIRIPASKADFPVKEFWKRYKAGSLPKKKKKKK